MRLGKILLVLGMGLFLGLAAINNVLMAEGGFGAVGAAVGMETTFQHPNAMWRAITNPTLIWIAFGVIVIGEFVGAYYCFLGAYQMWGARASAATFNDAKSNALLGLTITAVLYFLLFHAIAQEWFMLWQSAELGHKLQEAFRNFAAAILLMLWLNSEDR